MEFSRHEYTGVGCHALLQGIFPTQGSNLGFPHGRQILYRLNHQGSPNSGTDKDIDMEWKVISTFLFFLFKHKELTVNKEHAQRGIFIGGEE